jgi:hypothetical protein
MSRRVLRVGETSTAEDGVRAAETSTDEGGASPRVGETLINTVQGPVDSAPFANPGR